MERAALYTRVSTDKQVEKYGLGAQATALRQRVAERGYLMLSDGAHDLFSDDGYSGATLDRPALNRLRQVVRSGQVQVLLSYAPDRVSRELLDLLTLAAECEQHDVRLEFITQETDRSEAGHLFFAIRGAIGQFDRATPAGVSGGRAAAHRGLS